MYLTRHILMMVVLVSVASCSPVFKREAQLVPTIVISDEPSTASAQMRSTLREILDAVAEYHGLKPCPSFLGRKYEIGRFCSPDEGVHYQISIRVIQKNDTVRVELEEPDAGAFWRASESDRARTIWSDLIVRLNEKFPGCVRETRKPQVKENGS